MFEKYEMIIRQYHEKADTYRVIEEIVLKKLNQYVQESNRKINCIESRIKTEESLKQKLGIKGYKYKDIYGITDIVGLRLVTFYNEQIDLFAARIENDFIVDWDNTIDKRKIYKVDQFGYMSLHYICQIPKSLYYDPYNEDINKIRFEIQIRSILQHALANVQHDTGYKSDVEIPNEYLRQLNRIASLLEFAEESIVQVRKSIDDYKKRVQSLMLDGSSEAELNGDTFEAYVNNGAFDELNNRMASLYDLKIEKVPLINFLKIFKAFEIKTIGELDKFVKDNSEIAYEYSVRVLSTQKYPIITTGSAPLALCVVHMIKKGLGYPIVEMALEIIYGKLESSHQVAKKLVEIGQRMGITKEEEMKDGKKE